MDKLVVDVLTEALVLSNWEPSSTPRKRGTVLAESTRR